MGCAPNKDNEKNLLTYNDPNNRFGKVGRGKCVAMINPNEFVEENPSIDDDYKWNLDHENALKQLCMQDLGFTKKLYTIMLSFIDDTFVVLSRTTSYPIWIQKDLRHVNLCKKWHKSMDCGAEGDHSRLVMIGAEGSGKTSITQRFDKNNFSNAYDPRMTDSFLKHKDQLNGFDFNVTLIDFPQNEMYFGNFFELVIQKASMAAFVYSIDDRSSFDYCKKACKKVFKLKKKTNDRQFAGVLVCNKCDVDDVSILSSVRTEVTESVKFLNPLERVKSVDSVDSDDTSGYDKNGLVSFEEGVQLAQKYGMPLIQTSAKEGKNVDLLFEVCIRNWCLTCETDKKCYCKWNNWKKHNLKNVSNCKKVGNVNANAIMSLEKGRKISVTSGRVLLYQEVGKGEHDELSSVAASALDTVNEVAGTQVS